MMTPRLIRRVGGRLKSAPDPANRGSPAIDFVNRGMAYGARAIQVTKGASMFAIPFSVNMNESGQIGAGVADETERQQSRD